MLDKNLHVMGGIYNKSWWWNIFIKLPFWWLGHLSLGNSWWILEHSSHYSVILTYNEINYKTAVTEYIFYHIQNCIRINDFRDTLKLTWEIMFLCLFSHLIFSITILEDLWIEDHNNNPFGYAENDEGMSDRWVIYNTRQYILPPNIICNDYFYLVFIYLIFWYSTRLQVWSIVVWKCSFYLYFKRLFNH